MPLYKGNTNQFLVRGFRDPLVTPRASSYLNEASVATWDLRTVTNGGGTSVESGTLTYVTDSNGDYSMEVPYDADITVGQLYYLTVVLRQVSPTGITVQWSVERRLQCELRQGTNPNG